MRSRRALSTVVGAIFFVIAASTTIAYVSYSMNAIEDFAQSVIVAESQNIDRGNEKIEISTVSIDGGKFNATILNTGPIPAHLTRLWVVNDDLSPPKNEKGNLDVVINSGSSKTNIGQSLGIAADKSVSYTLKAVTERGNIATFKISNDVSTNIKLLVPGGAIITEPFTVSLFIMNNSTVPTNIVDLEPTLSSNVTLVQIGTNQSNVKTLKTGEMATFSWQYEASILPQGISFNGSYVGAPTGAFHIANSTIYDISAAQQATTSQWSEKARKVGILISGIPSPIDTTGSDGLARFGIGIINPLQRPVFVYSVALATIAENVFTNDPNDIEPTTGWGLQANADHSVIYWQAGTGSPVTIPSESVGQFRVTVDIQKANIDLLESPILIEALTSEGKMTILYTISIKSDHPTLNVFYTKDPLDPIGSSDENWGYQIDAVPSGAWKIYNATVENTSSQDRLDPTGLAKIKMIILIPGDFTYNTICPGCDNSDWTVDPPITNPDGSVFLQATSLTSLQTSSDITFQFNATAPTVSDDSLYVFQTTTFYPGWDKPQITSALSEAGVEVIPPP